MNDTFSFDVFLSHNSADKPRVLRLAERLKEKGLRVWLDDWVIKPGDDIYLAVEQGLQVSRVLVLCMSPDALGSGWVGLERSTVLFRDPGNAGRRFIPLLLADCELPDTLRRYRHVDYRKESNAAFAELLAACRGGEKQGSAKDSAAQLERPKRWISGLRARASGDMAGKIFINYRRDDDPNGAARVRDSLANTFGETRIFMDVDNLLVGQRFDEELAKALAQCDVLIAVIGPRWMELLWKARAASGEHDYVREEIAEALKRKLVVIPVRVGLEGRMPALPREQDLPDDIRALVLHQKQDVAYERFGRDIAELIAAIEKLLHTNRPQLAAPAVPWWGWVAGTTVAVTLAGWVAAHQKGVLVWRPVTPSPAALEPLQKDLEGVARRMGQVGATFRDCNDGCPEMVVVPAGNFTMGSPASERGRRSDEGPQRTVTIRQPFAVGKFEVTFAEYEAFVATSGGVSDGGGCNVWTAYGHQFQKDRSYKTPSFSQGSRNPVVCVTWQAATTFASWLTAKTRKKYRLLSEAEWEYAARAGSTTRYFFGDDEGKLCAYGNGADRTSAFLWGNHHLCNDGVGVQTAEVGEYGPNAFGLHDTIGNASEWVQDCLHPNYDGAPTDGSAWMSGDCSQRVIRGGSWDAGANDLRSAARGAANMQGSDRIGFRVAREIE